MTPWFKRKFSTIEDNGLFPTIIERLEGTPARLWAKIQQIPNALHEQKLNGKWSIKEEIGHLIDLEPLWYGRVEDLKSRKEELRAADLTNAQTHQANHNQHPIWVLLTQFATERAQLVVLLRSLTEKDLEQSALHSRLKTPMRLIDLAYFVAEHDDHHLVHITKLSTASQ